MGGLVRSPPESLGNLEKKVRGSIYCDICNEKTDINSSVECQHCHKNFDAVCGSLSKQQLEYFIQNNISWHCPKCFYTVFAENNAAVSQLSETVNELKNSMQKIDELNSRIPNVFQEFRHKIDQLETKVNNLEENKVELRVNEHIPIILKNYIPTNEGAIQTFNHKQILINLFKTIDIQLENYEFIFKWHSVNNSMYVRIISPQINQLIRQKAAQSHTFQNIAELTNSSQITFEFQNQMLNKCSDRIDDMEIRENSKDIKISGIPIQSSISSSSESNIELKSVVLKICQKFCNGVSPQDVIVRRIKGSQAVIVSFNYLGQRDDVFYGYIKHVSSNKSILPSAEPSGSDANSESSNANSNSTKLAGIQSNFFDVSFNSRITFSEHLTAHVRELFNMARALKQSGKLHTFNTRRGRLFVQVDKGKQFTQVNNISDLYHATK